MIITPKTNPKKFSEFLKQLYNKNLYQYKFLNQYIKDAFAGKSVFYDGSVISIHDAGWIMILHGDVLSVYGECWKSIQFKEISEVFNLYQFTNYGISGDAKLIAALLDFFDISKRIVEKERILYRSQNVITFKAGDFKIINGEVNEINELAAMLQQYYHEEYDGNNDKTIAEMQRRVRQVIFSRAIYIMKDTSNQILGFCTIINPDIGILFIKTEYRNKGYGKILMSYCAQVLKKTNDEVYVMTDKMKSASNAVCMAVGFQSFFDYAMIEINRTR